MSAIKRLAGQTAIYGIPSILGRVLGYLLVPLYTHVFHADAYGTVNVFYAYASLLKIILTYGMETAFFRFSEQEKDGGKDSVYSTALISLFISSIVFLLLVSLFSGPVAKWIDYPDSGNYVVWFAWILALDALAAIPFARLRAKNKAKLFASINMTGIIINIGLNLFFIILCPYLLKHNSNNFISGAIGLVYRADWGIEYIFISNLVASAVTLALLLPGIVSVKWKIHPDLWRKMMIYAFPLLFAGMAGIVNETFDRLLLRYLLPGSPEEASFQVGIYAACYKISILMTIFIQAYKYAAEPFFFAQSKEKNAKETYRSIMNYFIIAVSVIFLATLLYLDDIILPLFLRRNEYWEGRSVIPILLMANLFLGVYYNLSIWYKLTGKTSWGAWLSLIGAIITLGLNFIWIPLSSDHMIYGYYGSAWATFICYGAMMILSYLIGQKYFRVNYDLRRFFGYIGLAVLLYFISTKIVTDNKLLSLCFRTIIMGFFGAVILFVEKPLFLKKYLYFKNKEE
jgi:O-antigen/teichoic acid export membrane protein